MVEGETVWGKSNFQEEKTSRSGENVASILRQISSHNNQRGYQSSPPRFISAVHVKVRWTRSVLFRNAN